MSDEPKPVVEDILGTYGFRLVWSVQDHCASVEAYKVECFDIEGNPLFWRDGSPHNGDATPDYEDAESYLEGFVKWDGCTELNQGQPHWCGPEDYKKHFKLLEHIYKRSFELMGREPDDRWEG